MRYVLSLILIILPCVLKKENSSLEKITSYRLISSDTIASNNILGIKAVYSVNSDYNTNHLYALDNYVIELFYDYGKDDKDKRQIDDILNSLQLMPQFPSTFVPQTTYTNLKPTFALEVSRPW